MMYPPSYAMDATAASGGPITILPQIMTGSPQSILGHMAEMVAKAQQFAPDRGRHRPGPGPLIQLS
jgi:hypothetical protein